VATRPIEASAMATPNRSLAAGATRGRDARGLPPHHGRDQKRYPNQYAGSITWIGRYGSAATV
jgi:hypothetical protein